VNSSYAESAHIPLAEILARNSQKQAVSSTKQAAHRHIEIYHLLGQMFRAMKGNTTPTAGKMNQRQKRQLIETAAINLTLDINFTLHGR
jgi:hypothetical protein